MSIAPSLPRLHSPFLCCPLKLSSTSPFLSHKLAQRSPKLYPCIRAVDLDQNTVVAISVGLVSVAVGIGIPVFYESQIDNASKRDNTQPCFPCNGTGAQRCRFCTGSGTVTVDLGGDEKEVSKCINCEGSDHLHAPHVKVLGFNLDTLIAENSKTMTEVYVLERVAGILDSLPVEAAQLKRGVNVKKFSLFLVLFCTHLYYICQIAFMPSSKPTCEGTV